MIQEEHGEHIKIQNNQDYTIIKPAEKILLKKIKVEKKPLKYAFLGGMWYTKNEFSFEQDISLPYPFSTYYMIKIPDQTINGIRSRSLIYIKTPIMILQFENTCILIEFDPFIQINNQEVFPFISLWEDDNNYIVSFYLLTSFEIKKKDAAWLGFPKKEKIHIPIKKGTSFKFSVKITQHKNWEEAVHKTIKKHLPKKISVKNPEKIFKKAQNALFRSYDHLTGSFLQLPWKDTTGFTFSNASYSLITYEAVRLNYFSKWYEETKDKQLQEWRDKLKEHFINPALYTKPTKTGKGIIWYNMTNLTKQGLKGYFYMACGYSGYPGGQATISYHLLKYLKRKKDEKLKSLVKQSLTYIMSTQKTNGSWPMAIKQEGIMKFRPEKLSDYETHGGTGEAACALIEGHITFKNKQMKKTALKALEYLKDPYPICYNGLRDIGLNEAEAFSAINIINACLDAYELTKEKKYLKQAKTYSYYLLPWMYLYNTKNWKLMFNFHPISYSITPRISPYETALIVSSFLKLAKYDKKLFWEKIAKTVYNAMVQWITENGGLSEGVFPKNFSELKPLPMEQTFATTELMNASYQLIKNKKILQETPKPTAKETRNIHITKKDGFLEIMYNKKLICRFDLNRCKITFINGEKLNNHGISFSFYGPYIIKNQIKTKIKQTLRGQIGKYLLSLSDIKYFITGVKNPKSSEKNIIDPFEKHIKNTKILSIDDSSVTVQFLSDFHKITLNISGNKNKNNIIINFDPVSIEMLKHDLVVDKVLFPIIGAKTREISQDKLCFKKFILKTEIPSLVKTKDFIAVDQTLATNWTHGGIYKGKFEIVAPVEK